jgi:mRNA-degrading endonuclease RelE of RelBE toxin-antitoxin system
VTGSNRFSIEKCPKFKRSFKACAKNHNSDFLDWIAKILEELAEKQYPKDFPLDRLPTKARLPEGWTFHKLKLSFTKGSSGQIRLMYIVDSVRRIIWLFWIYSHEDFDKRPPDKDITSAVNEFLNSITQES